MTIAFIGHRKIERTNALYEAVYDKVRTLIENDGADTFLFGSRSEFNDLCYDVVTELKGLYGHIKRVYVRAEYEYISDDYKQYLLTMYEDSFYPKEISNSGSKVYVERNQVMIRMCDLLIAYYAPTVGSERRSGTEIAMTFAKRLKKPCYNLCDCGTARE